MACMDDLVRGFHPKPGVRYTYTALNDKGRERAREFTPPLTEKVQRVLDPRRHVRRLRAAQHESHAGPADRGLARSTIEKARAHGVTEGGMSISNAFGSNWTGEFTLEQRMQHVRPHVPGCGTRPASRSSA